VWDEPHQNPKSWTVQRRMRGLRAQWAAEAARQQGQAAFQRYHLALLRAIHEEHLSLDNEEATQEAARRAGLELDPWMRETQNLERLDTLRRDHEAATALGIFGTPSFVFEGADPAYLKLRGVPTPEETLSYWRTFQTLAATQPLFLELKRPH
jgi:predicted DsbA family dithiol-disulfide isomerase